MKAGRTIIELAQELSRQQSAKRDFRVDTRMLEMSAVDGGQILTMSNPETKMSTMLDLNEIAHRQIGTALGIPAKYYQRMQMENPELLELNVNSWFRSEPKTRMIRTLDGTARAFLSDKYRRIDNYQIAEAVFPIIAEMPDARVESCEVTDSRMYLKVVNPRLQTEVVPGDVVQSGILISNSEVGMGSVNVQPLVYRLVCTNGMVVNDAATRKYHVGRGNEAGDDFMLYSNETLEADDRALMLKIRDTVRAAVDQARFESVVNLMKRGTEAKITTQDIPKMVELASTDYGLSKAESGGVLDHLIRDGELSLYGLANAVTRAAQDVESYDRSTALESIGYSMLAMDGKSWERYQKEAA